MHDPDEGYRYIESREQTLRIKFALGLAMFMLLAAALALAFVGTTPSYAATTSSLCSQTPDPARWTDAGVPDRGQANLTITAHRGAAKLAPENTLWAYRYAIAYGVEMIEVDVQQTLDGRFVSFHDSTVDAKTDGSGRIATMTYEEVRRLNAADNPRWRGSEYDPSRIPSLEEVLELARDTGSGIYFDMKESVTDVPGLVALANRYGVVERSVFLPYDPARAALIETVDSDAPQMFSNPHESITPAALFALTSEYTWFGSSLPKYSPEKIAAIHDGCGLVMPNVYQGQVTGDEAGDLLYARGIGADGAQVKTPDLVADVLDEPVATALDVRTSGDGVYGCLVDSRHQLGLPLKNLTYGESTYETRLGGCARLGDKVSAGKLQFAGDGSALGACVRFHRSRSEPDGFTERSCPIQSSMN